MNARGNDRFPERHALENVMNKYLKGCRGDLGSATSAKGKDETTKVVFVGGIFLRSEDKCRRNRRERLLARSREYAATLRAVMKDGADAIYKGPIAHAIVKDLEEAGSIITEDDLTSYHPALRDPLVAHDVGGFTMVGAPPPSSGVSKWHMSSYPWDISKYPISNNFFNTILYRTNNST
jgi:hypothetical protein